MNKRVKSLLCLLLSLLMLMSLVACKKGGGDDADETGASSNKGTNPTTGKAAVHTVRILNEADAPMENVGVYIYEDESMKELVWYDATDAEGKMSFEDVQRDTYVAVLDSVPVGYEVKEFYPLTGLETEIRLEVGVMTEDMDIVYNLGDLVMDFTVTDTEGQEYSLKKLLESKDAVILNFYYNGCVPCQMEFPFLQEAYDEYSENIAVIAMSPQDTEEAVAAFKKEHKLTFPMVACDKKWESIMQVTAYPTTVVIDRTGTIVLRHTGSVESAQTFKDVFAAVSGEAYEQKIYKSISEVPTVAETGTVENPQSMGATPKFQLTIEGGKEHYVEFLKIKNITLTVADPDAYVIYEKKTYKPVNGVVSLIVSCPDMNTPIKIGFGNSSKVTKTFTITMASQPGSLDNPYSLKMGDNKVTVKAGNDQGVYYTWTAKENGSLQVWCINSTPGVKYDCVLYNLTSYAQRTLNEDGKDGELGRRYVEVLVNKGDKVQMIAAVLPDESWNYRAGNFTYMAEFVPGAGRDKDKVHETTYTITVTDAKKKPMANVNFHTVVKGKTTTFATNADGVVKVNLPTGEYKVTMIVPEGYTSAVTEFMLSKALPSYSVTLSEKVVEYRDYTVTVKDTDGAPVKNATVVIGDKSGETNDKGVYTRTMELGDYQVYVSAPSDSGLLDPKGALTFPAGKTSMEVVLEYGEGSAKKPIDLTDVVWADADGNEEPDYFAIVTIPAGKTMHYVVYRMGGMIRTINGSDPVACKGTDTEPDPITIANDGETAAEYVIVFSHPEGTRENPVKLESLESVNIALEKGDEDGYFYSWKSEKEGYVEFSIAQMPENANVDIILLNRTNSRSRSLSADGVDGKVTLNVMAGDDVLVQIIALDKNQTAVAVTGGFTEQENTEDTKLVYSVTVKDATGAAMEGVAVTIGNTQLVTDAEGVASAKLVDGTYTAVVTVPEGYKADQNKFTLTNMETQANVVLTKLREVDYTVKVQLDGAAYTGSVKVQILQGNHVVYEATTTTGNVTTKLFEGNYTVKLTLDNSRYGYDTTTAVLTTEKNVLTVALQNLTTYTDYSVTVTDYNGKAYSGMFVQILDGDQVVASGTTDSKGKIYKNLETGDYTVKLTFSGTSYYYNANTAVLTGVAPNLTIQLAGEVDPNSVESHWYINDANMYVLGVGSYHIEVSQSKPYFTTNAGYNDCIFMFKPTQTGSFRISIDQPGVELRNYGSSTYFLYVADYASKYEDNALSFELKTEDQVGNVFMFLGVEAVEGITDLCITITRVGDPGFDMYSVPYNTDWQTGYKPVQQSVTVPSGKTIKYVDIKAATDTYKIVYSEKDGFYHVGSASGPVLYLNLGAVTKQYISFDEIINGTAEGAGGSPVRRYFFDENGAFVKREDYTDVLQGYIDKADTKYGLYPVTAELGYILQNAKPGWWDSTSPDYLLEGCNPDLGWLFACCYIQ